MIDSHSGTFDLRQMLRRYRAIEWSEQTLPTSRLLLLVVLDTVLISVAAVILLPKNLNWLFTNTDAELYYALDIVGKEFGTPFLFSNINPVAVLGTLMSQLNPFLHPIHYLWHLTNNFVVPYAFLAVLLYLATFCLGQALRYPVLPSRIAGYAISVFWIPFFGRFSVDIMAQLCPWAIYIICIQLFAWSLFVLAGARRNLSQDLVLCGLFAATFTYSFLIEFSYAALSLPFSAAFFVAVLASCSSKRELAVKALALAACVLCFVALDIAQIAATATQLSTRMADFVGHDIPVGSRSYLTSLLRNDYYSLTSETLQAVPYLKGLAWIGIIFGLFGFALSPRLVRARMFAISVAGGLCFFGLYIVSREYMVSNVIWPWPAPNYFEWIGYPIYALSGFFAVYILTIAASGVVAASVHFFRHDELRLRSLEASGNARAHEIPTIHVPYRLQLALLVVVGALVVSANTLLSFDHKHATIFSVTGTLPPAWMNKDRLSDVLAAAIAIKAGGEYRGSFLSTTPDAWAKRSYQMRNFVPMMVDYQRGDTIQGAAIRHLIDRVPPHRQAQVLRVLGISYVQYPATVSNSHFIPAIDLPDAGELGIGSRIFVYRVIDPNLGNYAPTSVEIVSDWKAFLDAASSREIDWRTTAFFTASHAPRVERLTTPSKLEPLIVGRQGAELRATTNGTSLIVLPRSFSNCYRWRSLHDAPDGSVAIVRVNLVQLGVLMRGDIHGRIEINMKWGTGAECLAQDVRDLYGMGIRSIATPQALHPKRYLGPFGRIIASRQQSSLLRILGH
jgi:hypothetical protein